MRSGAEEVIAGVAKVGAVTSTSYVGLYIAGIEIQAWAAIAAILAALCTTLYYGTKSIRENCQAWRERRGKRRD